MKTEYQNYPDDTSSATDFQLIVKEIVDCMAPWLADHVDTIRTLRENLTFRIMYYRGKNAYCSMDNEANYSITITEQFLKEISDRYTSQIDFISDKYVDILGIKYNSRGFGDNILHEYKLIAYYFLLMHEFCHIARGHLNLSYDRAYDINKEPKGSESNIASDICIDEFEINERHPLAGVLSADEIYKCECDADTSAGAMVYAYLLKIMDRIEEDLDDDMKRVIFLNIVSMASCAINSLFIFFEQRRQDDNLYYPKSRVRGVMATTELYACCIGARNFPGLPESDPWLSPITENEFYRAVSEGIENAMQIAKKNNWGNFDYDLNESSREWYREHAKSVQDFQDVLNEFSLYGPFRKFVVDTN